MGRGQHVARRLVGEGGAGEAGAALPRRPPPPPPGDLPPERAGAEQERHAVAPSVNKPSCRCACWTLRTACFQYARFSSIPTKRRSCLSATWPLLPIPANGSSPHSPVLLHSRTHRSIVSS